MPASTDSTTANASPLIVRKLERSTQPCPTIADNARHRQCHRKCSRRSTVVVSPEEAVARWCARPIDLGAGNVFTPLVLGPHGVPMVIDEAIAQRDPELAVLSAMAHGATSGTDTAVKIALAAIGASVGLDSTRSVLYLDLVLASLSEAAKRSLQAMDPAKYEYQSDFARHYVAQGRVEGRAEGRAELLLKQLRLKFGDVSADVVTRVQAASIDDLDRWAERILSAASVDDTLR